MLDQASFQNGGAICATFNDLSSNLQIETCIFVGCKALSDGGALSMFINHQAEITFNGILFRKCEAQNEGGAFWCSINNGAKLTIAGSLSFQDCKTLSDSGYGGALYAQINGENSYLIFRESVIFERCSGQTGGGMCLITQRKGNFTINGQCNFTNCSSSNKGGGIYLETNNGTINFNQTEQILIENCSCNGNGGGIYCSLSSNGQIIINNIKLMNCNSQRSGGGIYAIINEGGQIILDNTCELYQCESHGNGGGIYVQINLTEQFSFIIKDAYIHECKSITDTSLSYPESGFGGGLFIGCNGDYSPSNKLIDLRGMKIYINSADKYGQSLYIAMRQVIEFCQYGTQGEYVKGNYSDGMSNKNELLGIPMKLRSFNNFSSDQIRQQQQPLESLWRILGILKSAQVIVNVSNPNGKLIFHIEGKRMIPGYLNVKIFEFGDKTQENIDQEQKVINYQYNKNNLKSFKGTSTQSPISQKHQKADQQQVSINTTPQIKKNLHNYENEIIYPPVDGSSFPIQIDGELESEQKATFGMNDYKWLNCKIKEYGVLISNDRNIFTGKDGIDIEEDSNAAVPLEVIIEEEEEEEKRKGLPIGIIVGIAVGALAIIAVIIIIIIVTFVISKKKLKNDSQMHALGIGVCENTLETKLLQDNHSPDVINQSLDNNLINITEQQPQQRDHINILREQPYIIPSSSSIKNSSSSSSEPNFITTWKLSDFEKIKKIGKGAFGTVWKMKEIKSQRIVAIKEVDYDSDEEKQRF
ncbi:MAG: hypothetical protein EZS28_007283, partial [Streblomastix strix]